MKKNNVKEDNKERIISKSKEVSLICKKRGYSSLSKEFWEKEFVGILYLIIDQEKIIKEQEQRIELNKIVAEQEFIRTTKKLEELANLCSTKK